MTEPGERRQALRCNIQFTLKDPDGESYQGIRFTAVADIREYYTKPLREWLGEYFCDKYGAAHGTDFDITRGAFI